ncbi:MAG: hypothetical protein EZS28_048904, partial [Streblomastix strix]
CDNILLHCPPGSGRVHAKISDFGFAKKDNSFHESRYLCSWFHIYKLITHKYPVNERNLKEQARKMCLMNSIDRPSEFKDNVLWDLLSKLLEFDPDKRITAVEAHQHSSFTSNEAIDDVSKEQQDLAQLAANAELEGDSSITEFDKDPTFIVAESIIKQFKLRYIQQNQPKQQNNFEQIKYKDSKSQNQIQQTVYVFDEQDNYEETQPTAFLPLLSQLKLQCMKPYAPLNPYYNLLKQQQIQGQQPPYYPFQYSKQPMQYPIQPVQFPVIPTPNPFVPTMNPPQTQ